jgi:hypothetical protein
MLCKFVAQAKQFHGTIFGYFPEYVESAFGYAKISKIAEIFLHQPVVWPFGSEAFS